MMSTNSPCAWRMPVLTAAPLPLLYGWRMTHAPASAARAAVASAEPSSTTRISRQGAAARRWVTTSPIAPSSLKAGITIDTVEGSAKQLLHHAIPGDLARACETRRAEPCSERAIGRERRDRGAERPRFWRADEAVLTVDDEFERASRVGAGDHRFAAEKSLQRHVPIVFIEGRVDDGEGAGVETHQFVPVGLSFEYDAIVHAAFYGGALGGRALGAITGDDKRDRAWNVRHGTNHEVGALDPFEPADHQRVIAVRTTLQAIGHRRRMVQAFGGNAVEGPKPLCGIARV